MNRWWEQSFWQILTPSVLSLILAIQYGVCTQDDAFISFRYADNWAQGLGWVFNPNERVEGFSNPSWTFLFGLTVKLGLDPVLTSLIMGYLSLILYIICTHKLLSLLEVPTPLVWSALLLLGGDPSLTLESVQGLESVFYAGMVTGFLAFSFEERQQDIPHRLSLGLGMLLCITRPDAPLFLGLVYTGLLIWDRNWKRSTLPLIGIGLWLGLITGIRWIYYGDILPNTAYAKVGGIAIERGLQYCWNHLLAHPIIWLAVPLSIWGIVSKRHSTTSLWLLWCTLPYLAYIICIGGDFKPTSRFLLPLGGIWLPLFMLHIPSKRTVKMAFFFTLLGFSARWPLFQTSQYWASDRRNNLIARKVVGEWIEQHTPPDTVIAMHSIGVVPYYANRVTIDMWGLTDRVIARTPASEFGSGMAGHEKSNPAYVFSRNPDLYLPEDGFFQPNRKTQTVESGFPEDFETMYSPVSIKIEGSWLNIWVRNQFLESLQR